MLLNCLLSRLRQHPNIPPVQNIFYVPALSLPWFAKCGSACCQKRTQGLKSKLLLPASHFSFTVLFVPNLPPYVTQTKVSTTLLEWKNNRRCVFIDGRGELFQPAHCFFVPPDCPSSTETSLPRNLDRVLMFALTDNAFFDHLFLGPLRPLSFRHFLSLQNVKFRPPPHSSEYFQCREGDALVYDRATLLKARQLNPCEPNSCAFFGSLCHQLQQQDSIPCQCGCVLPSALVAHTFNIPSK